MKEELHRGLAIGLVAVAVLLCGPPPAVAAYGPAPAGVISPSGVTARLLVLRPNRVDLSSGLQRWSVPRPAGAVTLPALARIVGDRRFLAAEGDGVYRLSAGLVQAPGTRLVVSGPQLRTLLLDNGGGADGAYLQGSDADLVIAGVTVRAAAVGRSVAAVPSRSRAFLAYRGGSRLTVSDARLDSLGATRGRGATGLSVSGGSRLTVERTEVSAALTGISVSASELRVSDVTVREARDDGVNLAEGAHAEVSDVVIRGSGRDGLVLREGAALRQTGGLTVSANRRWGVFASRARGLALADVTAEGNGTPGSSDGGGMRLSACRGCALGPARLHRNFGQGLSGGGAELTVSAVDVLGNDGEGIDLSGCHGCRVARLTASTNRTSGLVVRDSRDVAVHAVRATDNGTSGVRAQDCLRCTFATVTVTGGRYGVQVAGRSRSVRVGPGAISATSTGLIAEAEVRDVDLVDLRVIGTEHRGLDLAGRDLRVTGVTVGRAGETALVSDAPGLTIARSRFEAADRALHLHASASVTTSEIRAERHGLVVDGLSRVQVSGSDIRVAGPRGTGIRATGTTVTTLSHTSVAAQVPLVGHVQQGRGTQLPLSPDWLAVFAVAVFLAALLLEILRRVRETPGDRTVPAPVHVSNTV